MSDTSRAVASSQGTMGQHRPEHGHGPPTQIDLDRQRRPAAVLCEVTPTTEEKYDNGGGPKRIEKGDLRSIQGPEEFSRLHGCGLPKK